MPAFVKTPVTGGETKFEWYPDGGGRFTIKERLTFTNTTGGTGAVKLTQNLPGPCKVLVAEIRNATAVNVAGDNGTSGTATRFGLIMGGPVTNTSTAAYITNTNNIASNATATSLFLVSQTSTAAATAASDNVRNVEYRTTTAGLITSTVGQYLMLIPYSSSAQSIDIDVTTPTNGYYFGSTSATSSASIDVLIHGELYGTVTDS